MPTGVAGQLPDNLSTYMKDGRSMRSGPVAGPVECFSVYLSGAVSNTAAAKVRASMYIPDGFTVLAVTFRARAISNAPKIFVRAADTSFEASEITSLLTATAITTAVQTNRGTGLTSKKIDVGSSRKWLSVGGLGGSTSTTDATIEVFFVRHGHVNGLATVDD